MFENVEVLQLDEDNRVVVTHDTDSESPVSWGYIGILQVRAGWHSGDMSTGMTCPKLQAVADRIKWAREECENYMPNVTDDDVERAGLRAARRAGYDAVQVSLGSVYCSDYVVFVESPGYGTAEMAAGELQEWADGEVYVLTHERRHTWRDDAGEELHTWDVVDSIGGFYGVDPYDSESLAGEVRCTFGLAGVAA